MALAMSSARLLTPAAAAPRRTAPTLAAPTSPSAAFAQQLPRASASAASLLSRRRMPLPRRAVLAATRAEGKGDGDGGGGSFLKDALLAGAETFVNAGASFVPVRWPTSRARM